MASTQTEAKRGRLRVTWTSGSAIKRVDITDLETGATTSGRDWASWDTAYREALFRLARQQDSRPRSRRR